MTENVHLNDMLISVSTSSFRSPHTQKLIETLNAKSIDMSRLKTLTFEGLPDEPQSLRSLVWRILLKLLPPEPSAWDSVLATHRRDYEIFKNDLISPQGEAEVKSDCELWDLIEKDVRRTRQDMHFFFTPSDPSLTYNDVLLGNVSMRKYTHEYITGYVDTFGTMDNIYLQEVMANPDVEKHADVVSRILMVYAKLNPGVRYVQGMNELLAPLYYLFAHESHPLFAGHAEADAFFCFTELMSRVRDTFVNSLDSTDTGLNGQMKRLDELIELHEVSMWSMLKELRISIDFFGIKWIVLLLTQELSLPDVFQLWDCLLVFPEPFQFLHYVCLVLVLKAREDVLSGDFGTALHGIQRPTIDSIESLIDQAQAIFTKDHPNYKFT